MSSSTVPPARAAFTLCRRSLGEAAGVVGAAAWFGGPGRGVLASGSPCAPLSATSSHLQMTCQVPVTSPCHLRATGPAMNVFSMGIASVFYLLILISEPSCCDPVFPKPPFRTPSWFLPLAPRPFPFRGVYLPTHSGCSHSGPCTRPLLQAMPVRLLLTPSSLLRTASSSSCWGLNSPSPPFCIAVTSDSNSGSLLTFSDSPKACSSFLPMRPGLRTLRRR